MTVLAEPIQDIAHLGFVELFSPRPEDSEGYFTELLGMAVVRRDGASAYLRGFGDYASYTLKLTGARQPGIGAIGWRAVSEAALERRVAAIEAAGLGRGWQNGDFAHGRSYAFSDPDGHAMEIYHAQARYEAPAALRSSLRNQPMKTPGHGVGVRRLDHVALLCRDVPDNRGFAEETLGLRLREQVRYEGGAVEVGSWLSPNAVHHELAYVVDKRGTGGRLHHLGLWVDNRDDVLRAADLFREAGVFLEAGPSKHNNSQAFYVYSYEPGGNRIEIYTGGFLVLDPDFEPVIWDETTRGGGVHWGAALPASFLDYATPDEGAAPPEEGPPAFDPR